MLFLRRMEFFLSMKIPDVTHQEKRISVRNGKPVVYEDERLRDARQKFTSFLALHTPLEPLEGPVFLQTRWLYLSTKQHAKGTYKTTKPDTDNLVKLFKDCMTKTKFWKDDAQVAAEYTTKLYWNVPGIHVVVGTMAEAIGDGGPEEADEGSD